MTENNFVKNVKELGIEINDKQLKQLEKYYELLIEWNEKINLTGITKKEDVYLKHFYDSLTIQKIIDLNDVETLCDVGTGAGFPGLVLKIVFPNLKVTLLDALNKRINFLNDVIEKLELKDIETIHSRSEDYALKNREKFDVVTARAVASLPVLIILKHIKNSSARATRQPKKPVSSPIAVRIKSFSLSGTRPACVYVPLRYP